MSIDWNLDFGGQTIDAVDKSAGTPPDGYYRAKLHEVVPDDDGRLEFKFKICHGIQTGRTLSGKLNNPQFADTAEHRDSATKKARVWAVRLGLVSKESEGKVAAVNWNLAIGREVVVNVETTKYEKKDKNTGAKTGVWTTWQEIKYAGVWPLDHVDIDGPTRASLDLPLLAGQSATDPKAGKGKGNGSPAPGTVSRAPSTAPTESSDSIAAKLFS